MTRLVLLFLILPALLLILHFQAAEPGSPDGGLLILAGTSSLLDDGTYDIVQRPPFYSMVLAGIAVMTGVDSHEGDSPAVELGNIQPFFVAADLLEAPFLRAVLVFHAGLWALSLGLLVLTLRRWGVSRRGMVFALGVMALPSAWMMVGQVYDTVLCQCLLAAAVYFIPPISYSNGQVLFSHLPHPLAPSPLRSEGEQSRPSFKSPLHAMERGFRGEVQSYALIGICLALLGITRATFQLLSPTLIIIFVPIIAYHYGRGFAVRVLLALFLPWFILVGGWSLHNLNHHGVLGVSGVTGVALSTKTALYMEDTSNFPDETPDFVRLRDETFLTSEQRGNVVFWGARAANWLMAERSLSYDEANRLLTRYNVSVITHNPLNYLAEVLNSVVNFHFPVVNPAWSGGVKMAAMGLELLLLAGFVLLSGVWAALHVLRWSTGFVNGVTWRAADMFILLLLVIFYYTAAVSSAADVGKPDHRLAVQMVIPVTMLLIVQRFRRGGDVFSTAAQAPDSAPDHPTITSSTKSSASSLLT